MNLDIRVYTYKRKLAEAEAIIFDTAQMKAIFETPEDHPARKIMANVQKLEDGTFAVTRKIDETMYSSPCRDGDYLILHKEGVLFAPKEAFEAVYMQKEDHSINVDKDEFAIKMRLKEDGTLSITEFLLVDPLKPSLIELMMLKAVLDLPGLDHTEETKGMIQYLEATIGAIQEIAQKAKAADEATD